MGQPAAKQGDKIVAVDTHIVMAGTPPAPSTLPLPFMGVLSAGLSADVKIMGMAAATVDSTATNAPPHIPAPGATFNRPPSNKGTIKMGSPTVKINGKMAARNGDMAVTCNDPSDQPVGKVVAVGTVFIG